MPYIDIRVELEEHVDGDHTFYRLGKLKRINSSVLDSYNLEVLLESLGDNDKYHLEIAWDFLEALEGK